MNFSQDSFLSIPTDENAKVWRYMDLNKFIMLLDKQALFFSSLEQLKLSDPYEGYLPKPNVTKTANDIYQELINHPLLTEGQKQELEAIDIEKRETSRQVMIKMLPVFSPFVMVNCWHINQLESAAMWKLYCGNGDGIAIQSTVRRLKESFLLNDLTPIRNDQKHFQSYMGEVQYKDFNRDWVNQSNLAKWAFYKRKSFEHERELRIVVNLEGSIFGPADEPNDRTVDLFTDIQNVRDDYANYRGIYFPIDASNLMEKVYLSPTSSNWFEDVVKSLLRKFSIDVIVEKSDLLTDPVY